MKKIYYFAMAVLGTVAMVSCVKDVEDNNSPISQLGKNTITFSVNSGATTRSGGESDAVTRGVTIPLGGVDGGPSFCLEETVTDLYAVAPITRGTPAYTENAGVLYANNMAVYSGDGTFGDATFENMDNGQIEGGGWRYYHTYAADPWPASGDAHFYLRMPADMTGVTFGEDAYTTAGAITFTYTSPATAAAQQDILFAYTEMDKDTYKANHFTNGMPVLFNHALTGVKFAIGNAEGEISYTDDTKLAITEVSFKGLKDHGTCTITPAATGTNVSADAAVWDVSTTTTLDSLSSGTYSGMVNFEADGSFGDNGDYPDSFAAAGNAQNLNDAAGTQTFWLIPQAMTADVRLTIKYTYAGKDCYWVIDLGSVLNAASTSGAIEWKAGQLRTYTIKIDEVNLKIEDQVHSGTGGAILGSTKDNVVITNTGNTDVFIRAAIVGQWLDEKNDPVFGFTDEINQLWAVESWYEDQFGPDGEHTHGQFVGLAGYQDDEENTAGATTYRNWTLGSDGYYYYTKSVAPGKATGVTDTHPAADPLFTSYEVKKVPRATLAGQTLDKYMYFTIEIATQAISARNADGSLKTDYAAAWAAALATGEGE